MIIAWVLMYVLKTLDWALRFSAPPQLFVIQQEIVDMWDSVLSVAPHHPVIPYEFMGMSMVIVVTTYVIAMGYIIVRRGFYLLFNR